MTSSFRWPTYFIRNQKRSLLSGQHPSSHRRRNYHPAARQLYPPELMKILLAVTLVTPVASWAQAKMQPRTAKPEVHNLQQALVGSANPHYLNIATGRFMYRHLRDTVGNHYAHPLPPGNWELDIVRFVSPRWLAVRWRPTSAPFANADTITYYISRDGAQTIIQL